MELLHRRGWFILITYAMDLLQIGLCIVWTDLHAVPEDHCEDFEPRCPNGEVIVIREVLFGRMNIGTCIKKSYGVEGCMSNITEDISAECSGKRECSVSEGQLESTFDPCRGMLSYIQASYSCLPVLGSREKPCYEGEILKMNSAEGGYIASLTTSQTGCGGEGSPWIIEAPRGQKVEIDLIDFSVTGRGRAASGICLVYMIVKEAAMQTSKTICGGQTRRKIVYRSKGNAVELTIVSTSDDRHFLIHYQFVGCRNMETEPGTSVSRRGNSTTVKCDANDAETVLHCHGATWLGEMPNCSTQVVQTGTGSPSVEKLPREPLQDESIIEPVPAAVSFSVDSISWGMVVVAVAVITLGMVACVLIIGVFYLKRSSHQPSEAIMMPRPVSEGGYEVCDFEISKRTSTIYKDGYRTLPARGTIPRDFNERQAYNTLQVWERPLPSEPVIDPSNV